MMILVVILTLFCALQAVRAERLLNATLWLAAVSALVALLLYGIGAWEIAVIELSVGAGLVTVLMVFAITMVGETPENLVLSRRSLLIFVALVMALVIALTLPQLPAPNIDDAATLNVVLWQERGLDVVAQFATIFSAVLGVLGLLSVSTDIVRVTRVEKEIQQPAPPPKRTRESLIRHEIETEAVR